MERNEGCFTLNTGARIPAVGLGTWQADGASCQAAVATALEVGYRHLDCAHLYGNENDVGQALSEALNGGVPGLKREDLFVTSKLWCTTNTPKRIGRAVEISLKNLGLQYLDLYLMHWPVFSPLGDATDPPSHRSDELLKPPPRRMEATWRAMEELVSKGLVRAIGLSNFNITQMEEILSYAKIVPAVNQVELHPFWRQDKLVHYCHSKGIHLSAHTPLGIPGGRASGPASSCEDAVESPAASIVYSRSRSVHAPMLKSHVVAEIAEHLARTPAQVILRWGVQRGTSVLPCSLRSDHIKNNLDILNWSLSEADWNKINTLEPQLRLVDGNHSYLSEIGPLQAVAETDAESISGTDVDSIPETDIEVVSEPEMEPIPETEPDAVHESDIEAGAEHDTSIRAVP
ncbi:unnamed protein product [Sphagnum balticum]